MSAFTAYRIFCAKALLVLLGTLLVGLSAPAVAGDADASLEVWLDGTTRVSDASWKLFLQPLTPQGPSQPAAQLARTLDAETLATGRTLWTELPPGTYRLLLKPLVAVAEAVPPQEVALLHFEPGQSRRLQLDLEGVLRQAGLTAHLPVSNKPAAVLTVRVQDEESQQPAGGAEVALFPEAQWQVAALATYHGTRFAAAFTGTTNDQGWVRLVGLPAGRFVVRVSPAQSALEADEMHAVPVFHGVVELQTGQETLVSDLDLPRGAALELGITHGHLAEAEGLELELEAYLDPGCGRLREALHTRQGFRWDESVRLDHLPPGEWLIVVRAQGQPGTYLEVAREIVQLESGDQRLLWLEAEGAFYRGRVLRGEEPVRARVDLLPQEQGAEGSSTPRAYADPAGYFVVGLPEAGTYAPRLTLRPDQPPVHLSPVEFSDPAETVELVLPDGRIDGQVVDANGIPASDAAVMVLPLEAEAPWLASMLAGSLVSERGHFEIENLPAGSWVLQAVGQEDPALRSTRQRVEFEHEGISGVRLVLAEGRLLAGRLTRSTGVPIVGARLRLLGEHLGRLQDYPEVQTDELGAFQAHLEPGENCSVHLQLLEPGLPYFAWRLPCTRALQLTLPEAGGRLIVQPESGSWQGPAAGFLVSENGGFLPLGLAAAEVPQVGSAAPLLVPNLAPGLWKLVSLHPSSQPEMWTALIRGQGQLLPGPIVEILPGTTTELLLQDINHSPRTREE